MIKMMGMISKYSNESDTGTLVLSSGDIKEFSKAEWIEQECEPSLGQQVLYINNQNSVQIRIITQEDIEDLKNNPQEEKISVEDTIEHYLNQNFKLATDRENNGIRTISMRYYDDRGDFGEAIITVDGSKVDIKETRNGKAV